MSEKDEKLEAVTLTVEMVMAFPAGQMVVGQDATDNLRRAIERGMLGSVRRVQVSDVRAIFPRRRRSKSDE